MLESSRGIPQHWQISCWGEPRRVLMETSNSFERSFSVSVFGIVSPFSQRDTAWRVTWTFSARASWERLRFVRSSRIISFVSDSGLYFLLYFIEKRCWSQITKLISPSMNGSQFVKFCSRPHIMQLRIEGGIKYISQRSSQL